MLPQRPHRGWLLLAGGAPLSAYLATAGGSSYFLDAGELLAASAALDIAHPPGEPLAALYAKLFSFLPLGSLAFRYALGQASAAALACVLLFVTTLRVLGLFAPSLPSAVRVPAALLAPVLWGGSYAIWIQAVRPELYALQALLLAVAGERLSALHARAELGRDLRPLYVAALAVGLGLANHPAMSVLAIPALVHAAARARRLRPWLTCATLGALGLLVYAYLPLRALADPPFDQGDPRTLSRLLWVMSARLYAGRVGDSEIEPLADRFAAVLGVALDVLHVVGLLLAVLGAYLVVRAPRARTLGVSLWLQAAFTFGVSPLINPPAGNPDAMGYMALGLFAASVLACAGLAVLLSVIHERSPRAAGHLSSLAISLVLGLGVEHVARNHRDADLSGFLATDVLDDLRVRSLPPRALFVATMPQTVFRMQELAVIERVRPDVALLALPLSSYPGAVETLRRRGSELAPAVASFRDLGELPVGALRALAARRPVIVELDAHAPRALYPSLVPVGGAHALVDEAAAPLLWPRAHERQRAAYGRVHARLARAITERETTRQLLFMRYMDAVHAAAVGQREAAQEAIAAALTLAPEDTRLRAFARALASGSPFDPLSP